MYGRFYHEGVPMGGVPKCKLSRLASCTSGSTRTRLDHLVAIAIARPFVISLKMGSAGA